MIHLLTEQNNTLHWILLLNCTKERLKRMISETTTTPHEFDQMSFEESDMLTHLSLLFHLHAHPLVLNVLSMCIGDRIDEVLKMVDGQMGVLFRAIADPVVGRPLVAEDRSTRTNVLLDDRNESVCISVVDQHRKTFSGIAVDASENPLIRYLTTPIVLTLCPRTLIDFYNMSHASNHLRVSQKILPTYIAHEILPVDDS